MLPAAEPREGIDAMNDIAGNPERTDADVFIFEVSDAALEAAASTTIAGAAISFPNAPTVSVLILCCGPD
jgi:hypothetical protein